MTKKTEETDLSKLKKEYAKIQKKYKLPSFDELDKEFEIRRIDIEANTVHEVRRYLCHVMEGVGGIFLSALDPQPHSLHSMIESNVFDKEERTKVFNLFKKAGYLGHKGVLAGLSGEDASADLIKEIWAEWPAMKKDATKYLSKVVGEWKSSAEHKTEHAEYLG